MFDDELLVCGSANLNRRSFLCDTELAFAVADAPLLDNHQRDLWAHLFPGIGFPLPPLPRAPGWGATLFQAIRNNAPPHPPGAPPSTSKLIPDEWARSTWTLPNGAIRTMAWNTPKFAVKYDSILDATSVDTAVENGSPTLATIVQRLEGTLVSPYRRPR
jgi:phosphatidylserine/phosphatidylglycerophosphate/cardiolipin synthase-like enzyme